LNEWLEHTDNVPYVHEKRKDTDATFEIIGVCSVHYTVTRKLSVSFVRFSCAASAVLLFFLLNGIDDELLGIKAPRSSWRSA
jgi:hypothetical protein